jgi:hypothetical protein
MAIISVCLQANDSFDYDYLQYQNWTDVELILAGSSNKIKEIKFKLFSNNTFSDLKTVEVNYQFTENDIVSQIQGEYAVWIQQDKTWSDDFLTQLKDFVFENKEKSKLLYGIGFLKEGKKLSYAEYVYPYIKPIFSLTRVLLYPYYFNSSVKFIWKTGIIKEYKLSFDSTLRSHLLREAIFNLDYITTVFQINGHYEVGAEKKSLSFIHEIDVSVPENFLDVYREKVLNKKQILEKNIWSSVYWAFKKSEKRLKMNNLKGFGTTTNE